ncbi:unnamed protein product, partial [Symbiodinium microadriaticum]
TKHLSKMLAGFGRYGKSRPPGLRVCSEGSFTLSNLMEVWGRQEGYTRKDILNAVRVHMFHEDQTSLRFSIEQKPQTEDTIIRVLPKRFERSDRAEPRERREGSDARRPSGSRPLASEGPFAETPKSAKDKLAMSLDDVIRSDARGTARASRPGSSTENYQRAQRVSRKAKQMGLTPETQHIREPPLGSADEGIRRRIDGRRSTPGAKATMAVLHMTEAQVTSLFNYLQSDRPMEHARAIWTNIHKEASPLTTLLLSSSVRKLLAGRGVESFRGKRGT